MNKKTDIAVLAAEPASRAGKWGGLFGMLSRARRKALAEALLAGITTLGISTVLTIYSGTALLFPRSWRDIVLALATLLGILLFQAGLYVRDVCMKKRKDKHQLAGLIVRRTLVGCSFILVLLLVCLFFWLRETCVYHFDPTQWLTTQLMADTQLTEKLRSGTDAATAQQLNVFAPSGMDSDTKKRAFLDSLTPEFINREEKLICVPLHLPHEDQQYVDHLAALRHSDGIRVILDEQPALIINWLTGNARMNLQETTLVFLFNYLAVIGMAMFLFGLRFSRAEIIWGVVFGVK